MIFHNGFYVLVYDFFHAAHRVLRSVNKNAFFAVLFVCLLFNVFCFAVDKTKRKKKYKASKGQVKD